MKAGEYIYREDSRDTDFVRHTKKCWSKGIVIDVEPTPSKHCKINVVQNGRIIAKGEKYFSQYPTTKGSPKQLKIQEMYKHYYDRIIKKEQKDDQSQSLE